MFIKSTHSNEKKTVWEGASHILIQQLYFKTIRINVIIYRYFINKQLENKKKNLIVNYIEYIALYPRIYIIMYFILIVTYYLEIFESITHNLTIFL